MKKFVYLAGPITGCTGSQAETWRIKTAAQLAKHGLVGVSPLRCEPLIGTVYGQNPFDMLFGEARAIAAKNRFDVQNCDMLLAWMPSTLPLSIGTIGEMFWADAARKPVILATDDRRLKYHPLIKAVAGWRLNNLDEAVKVCVGILGAYTGGKNV